MLQSNVHQESEGIKAVIPKAKPIIFLDIDDVLCINHPVCGPDVLAAVKGLAKNPSVIFSAAFTSTAKSLLLDVEREFNGLRFVISSTWRHYFTRSELIEVFTGAGLDFVAQGMEPADRWRTPGSLDKSDRAGEILQWLSLHHQGEPFVVLDDHDSGDTLAAHANTEGHPLFGRVLLCQPWRGLQGEHLEKVVPPLRVAANFSSEMLLRCALET